MISRYHEGVKNPVGFGPPTEAAKKAAIFARVPLAEARKLDHAALESGRPKGEIVTALLSSLEPGRFDVGSADFLPSASEVLTLNEAAEFLRVEPTALQRLAARGDVPARKIGREWRLSRAALLNWLTAS
jgi:excisionase family DNA binding protein